MLRVAGLRQRGLVPSARFLVFGDAEFYADPAQAYAQSWAVVTMLREGSPAQRAVFTALFAAFARGKSAADAGRELFPKAKLDALDCDLRAWLDAKR